MEPTDLRDSIITKVEKQKRSKYRYNLFVDEEYAFSVHEDTMIKHRLFKGERIDPQRMQHIMHDEEKQKSISKALQMIGRRPHSTLEIKRKLKQHGFEPETIDWTLEKLKQQNYINDEDFAKALTENRVYTQRKGRNYVRQELQQRGVAKELIQGAMDHINPEEEYLGALTLGKKKWELTPGTNQDRRRKTHSFLMRRGFTGAVVSKVLQEVSDGYEDDEDGFADLDEHLDDSYN
jgi:regulatory protein